MANTWAGWRSHGSRVSGVKLVEAIATKRPSGSKSKEAGGRLGGGRSIRRIFNVFTTKKKWQLREVMEV